MPSNRYVQEFGNAMQPADDISDDECKATLARLLRDALDSLAADDAPVPVKRRVRGKTGKGNL